MAIVTSPDDTAARQAVPTWSQWKAYTKAHTVSRFKCFHCGDSLNCFEAEVDTIRVGCRVKVWEEVTVAGEDGSEETTLKSKVIPASLAGPGCPACQYLMTKAQSAEMARYEEACEEWSRLRKPALKVQSINVLYNGVRYSLVDGQWLDNHWLRVPTTLGAAVNIEYHKQAMTTIEAKLEPWLRSLGLATPSHIPGKPAESQVKTPSKRVAVIDVPEDVLKMPKWHPPATDVEEEGL